MLTYALNRMVSLRDLRPRFQGHGITECEYLKNDACYGQSFYTTLIGNHTRLKRVARVCQHQIIFLLQSQVTTVVTEYANEKHEHI